MAIPSGSGTEVLKRAFLAGNNASWTEIFSGTANHIYTILSIICAENQGAAGTIQIRVNNGAADQRILASTAIASYGTFVWNDKFVLEGDDDLDVYNSTTSCDWWVSYIDQDWT